VAAGLLFPHAAQAIQIRRRRRPAGTKKWSAETSYAITSLVLTARLSGHQLMINGNALSSLLSRWPRCRPTRNRGVRGGPQVGEHERSVAITGGNRTARVAAEPSAAEYASELGLLHHGRAAPHGSFGRQPRSLPLPRLRPSPGWTCPMWRQPAPTPRTS